MSKAQALDLLKLGVKLAKAGDRTNARGLVRRAVDLDRSSELAWMWLASLAESPREALASLECVLAINPANEKARSGAHAARFQAGMAAAKTQQKTEARTLLRGVVGAEPGNELAWMWLAQVAESPAAAASCLEKALNINPANERARAGLEHCRARRVPGSAAPAAPVAPSKAAAPPVPPAWRCPLCQAPAECEPAQCPRCRALLWLDDLEAFFQLEGVDTDRVFDALRELKAKPSAPDFAARRLFGICFLNLKQFDAAAAEFQEALRFRPGDRELRSQVDLLLRRQVAVEAARLTSQRPRKTVLVVDDSPTIRKLATMTLERRGYRVLTAADGALVADVLREQGVPDLILLDIAMPRMDGYQLCKLLRHDRETCRVPIVMLSGKDGIFNKVRGRMAGSTAYITKPFEPEHLLSVLGRYCPLEASVPAK